MIQLKHFSVYYKIKKDFGVAVDDVSLEVPEGQFLVIMGQSGCGKTTLLKAVLGLCDYVEGQLLIEGKEWKDYDKRNNTIAYVSQEFVLYPHLTVYDNIAFPLRSSRWKYEDIDLAVRKIAQQVGLEKLLTRLPKQLSVGQQQRLAIARALVKKPKIVLYDEPFSNLDPLYREEMRTLIRKISKDIGQTVLYVTHDQEDADALADRVIWMEEGKIVSQYNSEIPLAENGRKQKRKSIFYQQKASVQDYTPSMLPGSRKAIFFDVLKLQGWQLFKMGLIILLFSFPIHIMALLEEIYIAQIYETEPDFAVQELMILSVAFRNFCALINIPLLMLFSVGFSGISCIVRQYAWGENIAFWYHFRKGIRQNGFQMLLLAAIAGVVSLMCTLCSGLAYTTESLMSSYLVYLPTVFSVGFLLPVGAYMTVCIPVYSNRFHQNVKLCIILYLKHWKKTVFVLLLWSVLFIGYFIPGFYCHMISRIVASVLTPIVMLGFSLFVYQRLDESINPCFFPELVGKGVGKKPINQ